MAQTFVSVVAHFFVVVGGSKIHDRLAHFFIDIYTKKYLYLEKLTPAVLNDMVNAVYVHAPDKSSGHRVQDVEISYNYIGILPANLLYDIQNGETA